MDFYIFVVSHKIIIIGDNLETWDGRGRMCSLILKNQKIIKEELMNFMVWVVHYL